MIVLITGAAGGLGRAFALAFAAHGWEVAVGDIDTAGAAETARECGARAWHGHLDVASATAFSGSPNWLHYVASKGALIAMTRVMARELGAREITVNTLAPGFTLTEASMSAIPNATTYGVDRGAIQRPAVPDDVAGAAVFLASPESRFITGQTLIVDGGRQFL